MAELLPTKTIPRRSTAAHHTRTKTKAKKQQKRKEWSNSDVHSVPSVSKRTRVLVDDVGDKILDGESSSQPVPVPPVTGNATQIPKVRSSFVQFPSTLTLLAGKREEKSCLPIL